MCFVCLAFNCVTATTKAATATATATTTAAKTKCGFDYFLVVLVVGLQLTITNCCK